MFSLGSIKYNPLYPHLDYVDMGRSNEMRSNYALVEVVGVAGVLPVHYPVICWVITESTEQWCHNTTGN